MKQLPGFEYDAKRRRAVFDGFVRGTRGKVRRQRTIENVTRDQALAQWKMFREDLASGRAIHGPITFGQFDAQFYQLIAAHLQESTRATQRTIIENHLLRYFGSSTLESITSVRVTDFIADMRTRKLSPAYINNAVRVLKTLLRQAVERDVLADFPLKKRVPKEKEQPLRLELKRDERERFFAAFDDEDAFRRYIGDKQRIGSEKTTPAFASARRFGGGLRADSDATKCYFERFRSLKGVFVVAVETGLRKSDLRSLRWESVDLVAGFIRVVMQKTTREALIPISRACRQALLARRPHASGYVFLDERGRLYSPTRIRRCFILAKRLANIQRRLRQHDLRHTFGCRLASRSVGLQIIAAALGHTTTRMAERYARPSEEAMRVVVAALDSDD